MAFRPGQTIRLSLLDFTLASRSVPRRAPHCAAGGSRAAEEATAGSVQDWCRPLAVVREPAAVYGDVDPALADWHNVTVPPARPAATASSSREHLVYISQGHVIQVAILTSDDAAEVPYFMLKYEGEPHASNASTAALRCQMPTSALAWSLCITLQVSFAKTAEPIQMPIGIFISMPHYSVV